MSGESRIYSAPGNVKTQKYGSSPISGRIPLFGFAQCIASSSPAPLGTSLHGSPPLRGPPSPATGIFEATHIAAARGNPGNGRRTFYSPNLTPGPISGDGGGLLLLEDGPGGLQFEVRGTSGKVVASDTHVIGAGGVKMKVQGSG